MRAEGHVGKFWRLEQAAVVLEGFFSIPVFFLFPLSFFFISFQFFLFPFSFFLFIQFQSQNTLLLLESTRFIRLSCVF